ncbi:MAG: peptidylprolyl isomerase [Candidatus Shapirobacteria bacterium]
MKKYSLIFLSSLLLTGCQLFPTQPSSSASPTPLAFISPQPSTSISPSINLNPTNMEPIVKLTTSKGDILIKLYSDKSPNTVANILSKAASGFYKNLTFHRVEPGFVVQGGDPLGNGTGGGKINSEINDVPFKRGSVGLARGMDRSISNDAQFYICLATQTCSHLSNEYVNFGEVIEGMDVVDKIAVGDKILDLSDNTK